MKWPLVSFNSLFLEPQRNGIHKPKEFHGSGTKIVNMGELFAFRFVGAQPMKRLQLEGDEATRFGLENGDLLFARRSLIESGAGKCVVVEKLNEAAVFESSLIRVRLDPKKCESRFYFYYFQDQPGRGEIEAIITGAAQKGIRGSELAEIDVHEPPLPTQRKIAGVLSAYDDLIENNTRRIAILEEMAQAIYREWFVNFRFPGHENVKLINSPLGEIPEGWKVVTVEELASQSTEGITPAQYPEEEFAHFSIPNYDKGQLPELETGATIQSNKFVVLSGCVMLSKLNPRIPRIWLPEPYGDYRPVASTEFLIVSPLAPATREFIYYQFQSDDFSGRFRSCSSGTSTSHQRVKPTDFVKLKALLPPSSVIEAFTNHVAPMCRLIHNRRIHNRNLRTTRDLLLPKLISGQLDVEDLDIETGENAVADASGSDLVCSEAVREGAGRSEPQASTPPRKKQS